jgi:hypothetical protein
MDDLVKRSKGKNFSCANLGQRKKSDFYQTPYSMTQQLVETGEIDPSKSTLEPACGAGAITTVLGRNGFASLTGYDRDVDFLSEHRTYDQIVTNPPFSLAYEFIKHAKKVATRKICFLLPLSYLHGKSRYDHVWQDRGFPLKCVYVFTRYPMLEDVISDDGKYKTGMMVYAWYVWDKTHIGEPLVRWIDNDSYVIKGKNK